ncbi:hypothetical protein TNCV_896901 [Trichonephila clavipes]|nr:hypothetical protein TNCV_896901 [Trichonephila clavipes]
MRVGWFEDDVRQQGRKVCQSSKRVPNCERWDRLSLRIWGILFHSSLKKRRVEKADPLNTSSTKSSRWRGVAVWGGDSSSGDVLVTRQRLKITRSVTNSPHVSL